MEPEWPPLQEPTANRAWQEVLKPLAAQMQMCAPQLAERIVDRFKVELPQLVPDTSAVTAQLASVEAGTRQLAQLLETGDDPHRVDLPPATVAIGRSGVQRQIPLADYIRSYRLGQEEFWQWLFDRITASTATIEQARALELATSCLFAFIDGALVQAAHVYGMQREAWLRSTAAARAAAIDDVIADRERDPQRASKRLRYDLNRHHVGITVWAESFRDDHDVQTSLTQALAQIAGVVSEQSCLVHQAGSLAIAAWISRPQPFTAADLGVADLSDKSGLPDGVGVGIGEPGWGIKGFRRTHMEASHAYRVASLLGDRAAAVTCYRHVAVASLASMDREQAIAFVNRVLGPLAADDEATYRIATTLAVYLEENRSPAKAAHRLTVHPNTVSYRVNQAEDLLGRPVDTNAVDLSLALALLPVFPGLAHQSGAQL